MKWILAVVLLAIGCSPFLLPGVLTSPRSDDAASATAQAEIRQCVAEL